MADLVLLHTSETHIARFDRLAARIAPKARLAHETRPEWLERAQKHGITDDLKAAFTDFVQVSRAPVLCTCSTLGPLADAAGAMRIDRPMMQAAARFGAPVLMAYCLESTCAPSMALLAECLEQTGHRPHIRALEITEAWPAFESGDEAAFAERIATAIRTHLAAFRDTKAVVLAQASMSAACPFLAQALSQPVLSSPEPALRATLGLPAS